MLVVTMLGYGTTHAQQNTVAAGDEAIGAGGAVSFSIGQVDFIRIDAPAGSVAQGVHQPYLVDITTGVGEQRVQLDLSAHPNPTGDRVWLTVQGTLAEQVQWILTDATGRTVATGATTGDRTAIPMEALAPATYHLLVHRDLTTMKTFRIIKQ